MSNVTPVVFVVDDDVSVRESLEALIETAGWRTKTFATALDFLAHSRDTSPRCLVLDVSLPGLSGLDLQHRLGDRRDLPIIFITGHGDIPMSVQAMKRGAIEFLTKPYRDQDLLDAIEVGLARDRARRESEKAVASIKDRFAALTPREREIMVQVNQGRLCKQIAGDLGIAETTVKVHRSHLMRKMKARSLPELSRMADKLKLAPEWRQSA